MDLTRANYRSSDAEWAYVTASQYKEFIGTPGIIGCEARALAELRGEFTRPNTTSLMIGSYVDAFYSGTLHEFREQHPEIYSSKGATKGELKSEYRQADIMIQRSYNDELFRNYMTGDKQVVMTGSIAGVPVKIMADNINLEYGFISDLKTVSSISQTFYSPDTYRMNFIENWGYDIQGAIYREIVRQNTGRTLPFYICAISKDKTDNIPHPRIEIIGIPDTWLDDKLSEVEANIGRIKAVKDGILEPLRCEVCDYCADTKKLTRPISMDELNIE